MFGRLYFLFLRWIAITAGWAGLIAVFVVLGGARLGVDYEGGLATVVILGFYAALGGCYYFLPRNLSWILSTPLSKKRILALNYLVSLTVMAFYVGTALLVIDVVLLVKGGDPLHRHVIELFTQLPAIFAKLGLILEKGQFYVSAHVVAWILVMFTLSQSVMLFSLGLGKLRPGALRFSARRSRGARAAWIGIAALGFAVIGAFERYFDNTFFVSALLLAGGCIGLCVLACRALGVARESRRSWLALATALSLVQVAFMYGYGRYALARNEPTRVVDAMTFLGPWGGTPSAEKLVHILESPLNYGDLKSVLEAYREANHEHRGYGLRLDRVLSSQSAVGSYGIELAIDAFDPREFGPSEVESVLDQAQRARGGGIPSAERTSQDSLIFKLIFARVPVEDTRRFLKSANPLVRRYGYLRARYFRDRRLVEPVRDGLLAASEAEKGVAAKTLSVLVGRKFGYDDYAALRAGAARELGFFEVACGDFPSTGRLPASGVTDWGGYLNVCAREAALKAPHFMKTVESYTWLAPDGRIGPQESELLKLWKREH